MNHPALALGNECWSFKDASALLFGATYDRLWGYWRRPWPFAPTYPKPCNDNTHPKEIA